MKTTVIITLDDLIGKTPKWESAFKLLIEKELPHTVGMITGKFHHRSVGWNFMMPYLDNGLLEVASHSRTHIKLPYVDYDSEIGGSKQDILDNLGVNVVTWISPFNRWDDLVIEKLSQYGYLVFRGDNKKSKDFPIGDLFKVNHSIEMGSGAPHLSRLRRLNELFNQTYEQDGIYHLLSHPEHTDWRKGSYADQHLDYISRRSDVLYTTLGGWRKLQ